MRTPTRRSPDDAPPDPDDDALCRLAHSLIPGGAHTYAKGDDQFPENAPGFICRGRGCHVWDRQDREFIEYGMGLRSVSLGHAFEPVLEAVRRQLDLGLNFSRPSPLEIEAAESLLRLIPGADMAKFAKNGSDVTNAAIRIARAVTGRDLVAVCRQHPFFSTGDWFIGSTVMHAGIPDSVRRLTTNFEFNSSQSVRDLIGTHGDRIACVIMEVEKDQAPTPEFLHTVRELCTDNGIVLVFDEIITGFRHHLGGAQTEFGITPDLSAFGKAMANGFAVSALVGKRELMEVGGIYHEKERVFLLSTTYGAETHALAAAMRTMQFYREENVIEVLFERGARLRRGVTQVAESFGLSEFFGIAGRDSNLVFFTRDSDLEFSQSFRTLFMQEMIRQGIICPSFVVSYSHSESDIDRTVDAVEHSLAIYRKAIDAGSADIFLEGRSVKPVFRARC